MRKKVDSRIRTLVENGVKLHQRTLFVIVGDKGRDQVVNLHYMLSKTVVKARPSVLWCYKSDLYLSSHRKKRMKQIQKMAQRGLLDPEKEDPFSLFVASTDIRYSYYSETHKILGNTYGMLVLQDFEALTPNLLARTIETVEGGGIIVLLLSSLESLTKLYSLTMDVHSRLRTESHQNIIPRFNERLVLSLAKCSTCILMDDELNVLPTSSHIRNIKPVPTNPDGSLAIDSEASFPAAELRDLQESLCDVQPAGSLVSRCKTLDQAKAVVSFLDAASEKTLRSTVALTAARGRGKSAALGLAIAGAIGLGYSNIFVTAPSPENLRTLFEFIFKGLDDLEYKEHLDYDLVESTNPAFGKAIVRVNIYRSHRQTVQYIQPQHHSRLAQAELLVIDEAAAIPLPIVKQMLGPYLIFLCSTVNGYEGTGRSLSLKLIQQLRAQGANLDSSKSMNGNNASQGRSFREIILKEPIRYAASDHVEGWLNTLLCLNAADNVPPVPSRLPHPRECDLYFVERDTLFSGHAASEAFLQRVMSLYISSHYKNSPNDLLLLADAPAHQLYVLLAPVDGEKSTLPDILAVVQIALEGTISKKNATASLAAGQLPHGDLIPWTVGQQFQDFEFPGLSGARIVRIAVHPDVPRAGYGSRAIDLLQKYFEGEMTALSEDENHITPLEETNRIGGNNHGDLLSEQLGPRSGLPPLLTDLPHRPPEPLHYLGTSFGLTQELYNFWKKNSYLPLYLRQTASEITGEHSILMLRALKSRDLGDSVWVDHLVSDFRLRFSTLLGGSFRDFGAALALTILDPKIRYADNGESEKEGALRFVLKSDGKPITPYDMKRLQAYASNLVDYHLILDLVPSLARAYFAGSIPITLSYSQAAILLTLGLQQKTVDDVERDIALPSTQVMALFSKLIRKLHAYLRAGKEADIAKNLPAKKNLREANASLAPHPVDMNEELEEAAAKVREDIQNEIQKGKDEYLEEYAGSRLGKLEQYAIKGSIQDVEDATEGVDLRSGEIISVKVVSEEKKKEKKKKKKRDGSSGGKPGKTKSRKTKSIPR